MVVGKAILHPGVATNQERGSFGEPKFPGGMSGVRVAGKKLTIAMRRGQKDRIAGFKCWLADAYVQIERRQDLAHESFGVERFLFVARHG